MLKSCFLSFYKKIRFPESSQNVGKHCCDENWISFASVSSLWFIAEDNWNPISDADKVDIFRQLGLDIFV